MFKVELKRCYLNINDIIKSLFALQGELTNSMCFVNGQIAKLADIEKMGYDEFLTKCHLAMPLKLYKYFSNKECMVNDHPINYSIQALQNNTVYMQTPTEFDDVYDSEISVDYLEYEKLRLIEYCRRCNLSTEGLKTVDEIGNLFIKHLLDSFNEYGNFENICTFIVPATVREEYERHYQKSRSRTGDKYPLSIFRREFNKQKSLLLDRMKKIQPIKLSTIFDTKIDNEIEQFFSDTRTHLNCIEQELVLLESKNNTDSIDDTNDVLYQFVISHSITKLSLQEKI